MLLVFASAPVSESMVQRRSSLLGQRLHGFLPRLGENLLGDARRAVAGPVSAIRVRGGSRSRSFVGWVQSQRARSPVSQPRVPLAAGRGNLFLCFE